MANLALDTMQGAVMGAQARADALKADEYVRAAGIREQQAIAEGLAAQQQAMTSSEYMGQDSQDIRAQNRATQLAAGELAGMQAADAVSAYTETRDAELKNTIAEAEKRLSLAQTARDLDKVIANIDVNPGAAQQVINSIAKASGEQEDRYIVFPQYDDNGKIKQYRIVDTTGGPERVTTPQQMKIRARNIQTSSKQLGEEARKAAAAEAKRQADMADWASKEATKHKNASDMEDRKTANDVAAHKAKGAFDSALKREEEAKIPATMDQAFQNSYKDLSDDLGLHEVKDDFGNKSIVDRDGQPWTSERDAKMREEAWNIANKTMSWNIQNPKSPKTTRGMQGFMMQEELTRISDEAIARSKIMDKVAKTPTEQARTLEMQAPQAQTPSWAEQAGRWAVTPIWSEEAAKQRLQRYDNSMTGRVIQGAQDAINRPLQDFARGAGLIK